MINLKVRMKSGKEYFETDKVNRDWAFKGTPKSQILEKYWHQVSFSQTISDTNAEEILALVDKLDELDSIRPIIELLQTQK